MRCRIARTCRFSFRGAHYVGLGLWHSVPATLVVEITMFAAAIWIYSTVTTARDRIGAWGFWGFMALMFAVYLANAFGPPPPNEHAIAVAGAATLLLFAIPYWVDRHRHAVSRVGKP